MSQKKSSNTRWFGRVKSYEPGNGYGFIECAEAYEEFGRDVYLNGHELRKLDIKTIPVGAEIVFQLDVREGQPRATNLVLPSPKQCECMLFEYTEVLCKLSELLRLHDSTRSPTMLWERLRTCSNARNAVGMNLLRVPKSSCCCPKLDRGGQTRIIPVTKLFAKDCWRGCPNHQRKLWRCPLTGCDSHNKTTASGFCMDPMKGNGSSGWQASCFQERSHSAIHQWYWMWYIITVPIVHWTTGTWLQSCSMPMQWRPKTVCPRSATCEFGRCYAAWSCFGGGPIMLNQ